MSERDRQLIARAQRTDWPEIDFEDQAESQEAVDEIHRIRMRKYHADEYMAGIE